MREKIYQSVSDEGRGVGNACTCLSKQKNGLLNRNEQESQLRIIMFQSSGVRMHLPDLLASCTSRHPSTIRTFELIVCFRSFLIIIVKACLYNACERRREWRKERKGQDGRQRKPADASRLGKGQNKQAQAHTKQRKKSKSQKASRARRRTRGEALAKLKLSVWYKSSGKAGDGAKDRGRATGTEVERSIVILCDSGVWGHICSCLTASSDNIF